MFSFSQTYGMDFNCEMFGSQGKNMLAITNRGNAMDICWYSLVIM